MNHIYKVIWNKAKHCYTVVSEIAKSHSQSNKRVRSMTAVVAAAMMLTGFGGMAIEAANPAPDDTNIKIGKGADFAIWNGQTGHDGITSGYIAIGENAYAWDGEYSFQDYLTRKWSARIGTKEYLLDFNQGAVGSATWGKYRVTDGTKLAGAIAIGKNTMARTGSVMIGDHTYVGKLGDIEVDPAKKMTLNDSVYSTTLGSSSYNSGSMSAVTGAFSIISNKGTSTSYGTQNFGATIYGSLNSIESSSASSHSAGMANSVLGFGNRTQNTNASLVWGTGNEVTNSIENVTFSTKWNKTSASDAQKEIIKAMQSSDQYAGGSVMAIGGGNKADWAIYSQLLGVQNTLTGTEKDVSKLTMINGYKNTVTNAQNTTIIGSNNTATNIQSTIVMGDHNTLEGRKNVISLGNKNTVMADDAVAIGNGTKVTAESGVAIGAGSVADRVAGSKGAFAPANIPKAEKSTWISTKGAFSVGEEGKTTRQITNVAAGSKPTDAVNVAQLKQVASQTAASKTTVSDGTNTTVTPTTVAEDGHTDYKVNLNKDLTGIESMTNGSSSIRMGNGGTVTINKKVTIDQSGKISGVAAGEISSTSTDAVNGSQLHAVQQEAGKHTKVVNGSNITVEETDQDGQKTYKVGLKKDLLLGDITGKNVSISGTNGTIETTGSITTKDKIYAAKGAKLADIDIKGDTISNVQSSGSKGQSKIVLNEANTGMVYGATSVVLNDNGVYLNGKVNVDKAGQIHNVTAGTADEDAVNVSQLKKQTAASKTTVSDGINTTVTPTVATDGHTDYKVNLNKDLTGIESMTNGSSSIRMGNGGTVTINKKVTIDQSGKISGVAAGEISSTSTDAVNGSQLHAVQQEAGKHTKVVNGSNITVEETDQDGQKTYKVGLKKDLLLGDITGKNVSISGTNGTIETTGSITTKDKIYAAKGAKLADIDITGDTISNGQSSVKLDKEGTVTINGKVNVDKAGQIHNVTAGTADEDAVNVSQLNKQAAASKTTVSDGTNTTVTSSTVAEDGHTDYRVNLNKDLTGIESISNGSKGQSKIVLNEGYTGMVYGDTNVVLRDNGVYLNGKVNVDKAGQIHNVTAGTADEDAVNVSQLNKQAAASKTTVSDGINTTVTSTEAKDGHTDYQVNLNKDVQLNSATFGDTVINANGLTIGGGTSGLEFSKNRVSVGGQQIHDVADGKDDADAVNMSQLNKQAAASKTTVSDGTNTTVTSTVAKDGHTDYKVNLNKDLTGIESMTNGLSSIRMGNGGTVTINNRVTIDQSGKISGVAAGEVKEGSTDAVNGSQLKGVENKADKNAENIQKNTEAIAKNTADISKNAEAISKNTENIKNNSKAIAENAKNIQKNTEAIAKNTADISKNTEAIGKLDERVTKVEEVAKKHTTVSTDDTNVQINEDTNKDGGKDYKVSLNKDLNLSSVTTGDTKMDTNGVTVKDVSLTKDGLSIGNKTYVSDKGLNANDQKVTNVAAGDLSEKSTDAVNGSQLFATNQQVVQNAQSISKLGNRINKVGAGAAALAALHPLDFDPDDKWDIAAGYGNYNGENAAAIGAYYRPNEDTMFSVGGSFGNGENMVNAGVSLKLGQGNHVSTSKVAMAKEIKDLRKELEGLKSALLDVNAGKKLDTSKLQLFPDVPKNHWAYEYVSTLKGNGVLTGYPDGEFKGDRPMTRYEFATMLYKAMLEGATLSDRILKEFAPELERFTVDTVHQDKDGKPTVERVRTVKAAK